MSSPIAIRGVWCCVVALFVASVGCGNHIGTSPFRSGGGDGGSGPTDDGGDPFADGGSGDASVATCVPNADNFDVPNNGCDDDDDGTVDNAVVCDKNLLLTGDALAFAKAIGLCRTTAQGGWGIVTATYLDGFGSPNAPAVGQHGIVSQFGNVIKPRQGSSLGILSSGWAREFDQCGGGGEPFKWGCPMSNAVVNAPPGFPKASPSCPNVSTATTVNDVIDLKLVIRVPKNAKGLSFDFNFLSGEWPEYVCTKFNDSFIAYLKSNAFNNGKADNVSFDGKLNPVSVNNGFFDRCSPGTLGCANFPSGYQACGAGDAELQGTGFYEPADHCGVGSVDSGGGGTGWLTTKAPVQPGETITLEFMIWDTGDHAFDSSVLLDGWTWEATDTTVGTVRPPN